MKTIDDLIDYLKATYESLENSHSDTCIEFSNEHEMSLLEDILVRAKELKANMDADDGWVSVEDILPEVDKEVLLSNGLWVCEGYRLEDHSFFKAGNLLYNVKYWKEPPSPPKGEK